MKLVNDYGWTKESIMKGIQNKLRGLESFLVDGRYRNNAPELKYMENRFIEGVENAIDVKIDKSKLNLHIDNETSKITLTHLDDVVPRDKYDDFVDFVTECLGFEKAVTRAHNSVRIIMEVDVK